MSAKDGNTRPNPYRCAVCGEQAYRPALSFLKKAWFFCSHECRMAFKKQPEYWSERSAGAALTVRPLHEE